MSCYSKIRRQEQVIQVILCYAHLMRERDVVKGIIVITLVQDDEKATNYT